MNYFQSLGLRSGGLLASSLVHHWMGTLDYKAAYHDPTIDPAFPEGNRKKRIYIFWHEYILFLLYLRRRCPLSMLLSRHRDADILEQIADLFGFGTVRGSSTHGGAEALREMMQRSKDHHLTITPDGPRGPRRKLAPGCVFLASKLQMPLVVLGLGYQNPWRVPTWDRFAVPKFFSRARAIVSPEINIPPDLKGDDVRNYCLSIEKLMTQLSSDAEDWANSGDIIPGESSVFPGPLNDFCFHKYPQKAAVLNDI